MFLFSKNNPKKFTNILFIVLKKVIMQITLFPLEDEGIYFLELTKINIKT